MGMYTELVLNVSFAKDLDPDVVGVLSFLAGDADEPDHLPNHPFFLCDRWAMVLRCSSYYFVPFAFAKFVNDEIGWYLSTRFDMKNYDSEIEHFIDWLMPHIDALPGEFLGYHRYEESDSPTLIFKAATAPRTALPTSVPVADGCMNCGSRMIVGGDHDVEDDEDYIIVTNASCPGCNAFLLFYTPA